MLSRRRAYRSCKIDEALHPELPRRSGSAQGRAGRNPYPFTLHRREEGNICLSAPELDFGTKASTTLQ
jgi:hypothetical protein